MGGVEKRRLIKECISKFKPDVIIFQETKKEGGAEKRRSIKECISKFKPNVIIFQETKKEVLVTQLIHSAIGSGFSCWSCIPVVGVMGGILIA